MLSAVSSLFPKKKTDQEYTHQHYGSLNDHAIGNPDSIFHGVNMGPTWVLSAPDRSHVGPMNLAIREGSIMMPSRKPTAATLYHILIKKSGS